MTILPVTDQRAVDFVSGGGVIGPYVPPPPPDTSVQDRHDALTADATLRTFIQTLKGFHIPADVQTYWAGLSATQKTNAIFMLVLYVASKE